MSETDDVKSKKPKLREGYLKRLKERKKLSVPSKKRVERQSKQTKNLMKVLGLDTPANAALTALTLVPGLGALGLAAKVYKGMKAGKEVYTVGNKVYKSKTAALEAAKKIKPKLPPKSKGNLSKEARGKEWIERQKKQKGQTPLARRQAGKNVKKEAEEKRKARIQAEKDAVKATGLAGVSLIASRARNKDSTPKTKKTKIKPSAVTDQLGKVGIPKSKTEVKTSPDKTKTKAKTGPAKTKAKTGPATRPASIIAGSGKGLGTLSEIAFKHGTTVKELMKANKDITDADKIQKGQKIKLGKVVKNRKSVYQKKKGGTVFRRGGGKALRGFGKATYSDKLY
tara:strand:- start:33 stop:1052 length:1020 start_codon:yes stop_codon:yes gene_type:complete